MSLRTGCLLLIGLVLGVIGNDALTSENSLDRRMTTLQVQKCTKADKAR